MAPQARSVDDQADGHRMSRPEHQDHQKSHSRSPNQQHHSRVSSILEYEIRFADDFERYADGVRDGGAAAESAPLAGG
jgi:hypothetical protein